MRTIKKIFLLLSYIAVNNIVQAQAPHLPGSFISHPELAKFIGDWKWGSGTDSVLLHLEKQFIHYPMPLSYDEEAIVGWHKYMKNGIMIESSLQYSGWPY